MTPLSPIPGQTAQANFAAPNSIPSSSLPKAPQKAVPHSRLTAASVKAQWKAGILNPVAYLLNLLLALKAPGWRIQIPNIQTFCDTWEINRRTFFRAKTKLLTLGFLDQTSLGFLTIWIRPESQTLPSEPTPISSDSSVTPFDLDPSPLDPHPATISDPLVTDSISLVTDGDPLVTIGDSSDIITPLKQLDISHYSLPPDPSSTLPQTHINSLSDRATEKNERENCINFSEEKEEKAYREWLLRKAEKLPTKPVFLNQWIASQMRKSENRTEFLLYRKASIVRTDFPLVPREMPATLEEYLYPLVRFPEADQRLNHLRRLQIKWQMPGLRNKAIAEAKALGFIITINGIVEA
jgi:hypothetical protein